MFSACEPCCSVLFLDLALIANGVRMMTCMTVPAQKMILNINIFLFVTFRELYGRPGSISSLILPQPSLKFSATLNFTILPINFKGKDLSIGNLTVPFAPS